MDLELNDFKQIKKFKASMRPMKLRNLKQACAPWELNDLKQIKKF